MVLPDPQTITQPFVVSVTARALGVDVSHWQGEMDWDQCKAAGAEFAVIRAGSINNVTGVPYYDFQFDNNAEEAPKRLPTWAYWYFRPKHDPIKQADYFADLIEAFPELLPIPVADCEAFDGTTPNTAAVSIATFLDRLDTRLKPPRQLIYTRQSIWDTSVAKRDFWPLYDLHAARYAEWLDGPWSDGWYVFRDWTVWTFWQFSADGNGRGAEFGAESKHIDINYFNGDSLDLLDYLGIGDEEPEPEPPPDELYVKFRALVEGQNIRAEPYIGNNIVGKLTAGQILHPVIDIVIPNGSEVWMLFDVGWVAAVHGDNQYLEDV